VAVTLENFCKTWCKYCVLNFLLHVKASDIVMCAVFGSWYENGLVLFSVRTDGE